MATASVRHVRRQLSKDIRSDELRQFFLCVRRGDVPKVKAFLKQGVDVNVRDPWDNCPLYLACLCGHLDLVEFLLRAGAKYDSESVEGQRCFLSSLTTDIRKALKGHKKAIRKLKSKAPSQDSEEPVDGPLFSDLTIFLQTMYERTPDYDIEILVGDQTFLGHKCILCVRCDYFYRRLNAPDTLRMKTLELTDPVFTPGSVRAILQFLYTGGLDLPVEDVEETQSLAAFLGFTTLANSIEAQMKKTLSEMSHEDLPEQVITVQQDNYSQDLVSDLRKLVTSAVPRHLHHLVGNTSTQEHTEEASQMGMSNMARNAAIFPDICFCVGDQEFECHKIFFYGRSEYFRIMLIEKQDDQPPAMEGYRPVVKLDNVTVEDFVQVISYLYQDHCLGTNQESLLEVCDRWALTRLKLQLTKEPESVTVSNVMQIYIANRHNEFILQRCYQCVDENFMQLAARYEFHQFLKRELPANCQQNQQIKSPFVAGLLHRMRSTAYTWQEQRFANEKIKKLNYIISNRLGHSANFTLFDITPVPPHCMRSTDTSNDNESERRGTSSHFTPPSIPSAPPSYMKSMETSNNNESDRRGTSHLTPSSIPSAPPLRTGSTETSNNSVSDRWGTSHFTSSYIPSAPHQRTRSTETSNTSVSDRRDSSHVTPSSVPSAPPPYMMSTETSNTSVSDRRDSSHVTPSSVPSAPPPYMMSTETSNNSVSDRRGTSHLTPSSIPSALPQTTRSTETSNNSVSDRRGTSHLTPSSIPSTPPQCWGSTETSNTTQRPTSSSSKTKSCTIS